MADSYRPPGAASAVGAQQTTDPASGDSTKDVAKEQASNVGHSAGQQGQRVAQVAKEQGAQVTSEVARQASDLVNNAQGQVKEQAHAQQQKLAGSLRSLSDELSSMSSRAEQPGLATDLAREAAQHTGTAAQWLEDREPGAVLGEVSSFARRRPGTFLAAAAGIGFLAGRLTRGLKEQQQQPNTTGNGSRTGADSGTPAPVTEPPKPTPYPTAQTLPPAVSTSAAPGASTAPPSPAVDLTEAPMPPAPYAEQVRP